MAQILSQNPGSSEAQSPLIAGITEGLNKLSAILNLKTSTLEDVSLTAVSIDDTEDNKNRIFEAPAGNRLWLSSPAPTFKKNGSPITQESSGFTIDYVGGSITFQKESKPSDGDTITVSATYIIAESEQLESILSGLSSAQTQANKYKGNYASYDALILAVPSGSNGDFAIVFEPLAVYAWKNDGWYDTRSIEDLSNYYTKEEANNLINQKEPSIAQKGSTSNDDNYYWGGRKTWQDLFAKVRSVTLTGLSTASDAVVSATDTVLVAIGKLQAQVSKATQRAYLTGTGAPTTSTVGAVGQRYVNTSNGDEYTCEAISDGTYTWRMHTRSVNGKAPTAAGGNVVLSYSDVGALGASDAANSVKNSLTIKDSDGGELASYNGGEAKEVTLTKDSVGLSNVDNTADVNKRVNAAYKASGSSFALGAGNTYARFFANAQNKNIYFGYDNTDDHYLFLGYYGTVNALCPNTDQALRLGTDGARWSAVWATSGTINTSDANQKKDIADLKGGAEFIYALRPVSFKYIDGESGRTHWGLVAQDVKAVMDAQNITDMDFAGWTCAQKTERTEDGNFREIPGEYEYGLRYAEFIAPLIAAVQSQKNEIDLLKSEISKLKGE